MRFVEEPHLILRKTLIAKERITSFASDIGVFMAKTLFGSSGLALEGGVLRSKVAKWSQNTGLCALTEKVIFTDPYTNAQFNHHTSPQLDAYAEGIRGDAELKLAAAYHKALFLTKTEALLHGDLHTGSIMVKQGSTFVIDPEFAFYGPIGFDVGAVLSNLFLAYFSYYNRDADYSEWLLEQIVIVADKFLEVFVQLWNAKAADASAVSGEIYNTQIYTNELLKSAQDKYLSAVWRDSLGFTGMKMIRRIVGIAHVADLESITDHDVRSACEKRALVFARSLVVASFKDSITVDGLSTIRDVTNHARKVYAGSVSDSWPQAN